MSNSDRRKNRRFDTSLEVHLRFLPDGTPIKGAGLEVGPNGLRVLTKIPLVEASYIHISFPASSNNTHCEGRVVWTRRRVGSDDFESGIDVQRWAGDVPGETAVDTFSTLHPKDDRRKKPR